MRLKDTLLYLKLIKNLIDNRESRANNLKLIQYLRAPQILKIDQSHLDTFEEHIKKGGKIEELNNYIKLRKEFMYLSIFLEYSINKYPKLKIISINSGKDATPDFLFVTENELFYLEETMALNTEEENFIKVEKEFLNKINDCFKQNTNADFSGGHFIRPEFYSKAGKIVPKTIEGMHLASLVELLEIRTQQDNEACTRIIEKINENKIFKDFKERQGKQDFKGKEGLEKFLLKLQGHYDYPHTQPFFNSEGLEGIIFRLKYGIETKSSKEYKNNISNFPNIANNVLLLVPPFITAPGLTLEELNNHIHNELIPFLNDPTNLKLRKINFFFHIFFNLRVPLSDINQNFHFSKTMDGKWKLVYPSGTKPISLNLKKEVYDALLQEKTVENLPGINSLNNFLMENPSCWSKLLSGFEDFLSTGKSLEERTGKRLLNFIEKIIKMEQFKEKEYDLTRIIANILKKLIKDKSKNSKFFSRISFILNTLILKLLSHPPRNGFISYNWFLNTPLGYVYEATAEFLHQFEDNKDILKNITQLIEEKLLENNKTLEFAFFVGLYFYEGFFINDTIFFKCFDENFGKIFPKNETNFIATFSGYLCRSRLNVELHNKLKEKNYYKQACEMIQKFSPELRLRLLAISPWHSSI